MPANVARLLGDEPYPDAPQHWMGVMVSERVRPEWDGKLGRTFRETVLQTLKALCDDHDLSTWLDKYAEEVHDDAHQRDLWRMGER